MDEDQVKDYIALTSDEEVVEETPVVTPQPQEPEEPEGEEEAEPEKKVNVNGIMTIILIIGLAGAGGFMYYNTTKNSKAKGTQSGVSGTAHPKEKRLFRIPRCKRKNAALQNCKIRY